MMNNVNRLLLVYFTHFFQTAQAVYWNALQSSLMTNKWNKETKVAGCDPVTPGFEIAELPNRPRGTGRFQPVEEPIDPYYYGLPCPPTTTFTAPTSTPTLWCFSKCSAQGEMARHRVQLASQIPSRNVARASRDHLLTFFSGCGGPSRSLHDGKVQPFDCFINQDQQ